MVRQLDHSDIGPQSEPLVLQQDMAALLCIDTVIVHLIICLVSALVVLHIPWISLYDEAAGPL